jgi:hypothetical protein
MKVFRVSMLLGLLMTASMTYGMKVKTDYDRTFDFGRLKTFAFKDQIRHNENTLVDKRIREALIRDLESRGFVYTPNGQPDFLVAYYSSERERVQLNDVGYIMPHRWRWGWGPNIWTTYYTQGSVVVDFVDRASNQLVWRGSFTDTVKGLDQSDKQIDNGVSGLVKHFLKDERKYS